MHLWRVCLLAASENFLEDEKEIYAGMNYRASNGE